MTPTKQLTLSIELEDDARLDNFYWSTSNAALKEALVAGTDATSMLFIAGQGSSGKSHILHAMCNQLDESQAQSMCFSLNEVAQLSPELLADVSDVSLICIDDFETIESLKHWETALFNLFNWAKDSKTRLIIASKVIPSELPLHLKDLGSRLQSMLFFKLLPLNDEEKKSALQLRASRRGFEMSDQVVEYILVRAGRDFSELMGVLDALDEVSLREQRKLSIPLVKQALGW